MAGSKNNDRTTDPQKMNLLPADVRSAVSYIKNGSPIPSRVTTYTGNIRVSVVENGATTWSLTEALDDLRDIDLKSCSSWSDIVRTTMKVLGQGDKGFAQLIGIPVATIRAWKQGYREPRGPGRRLLEVSLRYPVILKDVVRDSLQAQRLSA